MVSDPVPYKEAFPAGSKVRIADRLFLQQFKHTWTYHHMLSPEQFSYAEQPATIKSVGFYHGGDPVYVLSEIPGSWLEQCLRPLE